MTASDLDGKFAVDAAGDTVTVTMTGDLDLMVEHGLCDAVTAGFDRYSAARLVIDLTAVRFMDSSGLRAVLVCRSQAEARNVTFALRVSDGPVRHLLEVAGVSDWFRYE